MLDVNRLSSKLLHKKSGWNRSYKIDIEKHYQECEKDKHFPQVPIQELFRTARDIIETLDGICIKNLHPELGLGSSCDVIEFSYFNYDRLSHSELLSIQSTINRKALFIGIGYDIIGDWLVDESGAIYFRNKLRNKLHMVSQNIYPSLDKSKKSCSCALANPYRRSHRSLKASCPLSIPS